MPASIKPGHISSERTVLEISTRHCTPVVFGLIALVIALGVTVMVLRHHGHGHLFGLVRIFDLESEGNLPTVFSMLLLMACGVLCLLHASEAANMRVRRQWKGLAGLLMFLGLDEMIQIHELFVIHRVEGGSSVFYSWTITYGILFLGLCAIYLPFYLRLPRQLKIQLTLAVIIYVGGAVGMERLWEAYYMSSGAGHKMLLMVMIEESMEMIGLGLAFRALLNALQLNRIGVFIAK